MPKKGQGSLPANAPLTGPVTNTGLGLFYDRPAWEIPPGGLSDCNNVRIYQQRLTSFLMGWTTFGLTVPLNGPVTLIDTFVQSNGSQITIFGTPTDLYQYLPASNPNIAFITPTSVNGTVSINNGSATLTGSGTTWKTQAYPVKAGDKVFLGTANQTNPTSTPWYTVQTVTSDTSITLTANYSGTNLSGAAYTIRQLYQGDANHHHWNSETFPNGNIGGTTKDAWFAVNGIDHTTYWDGVAPSASLNTTEPFIAYQIRRFNDMLCYGGLVNSSGQVQGSGFANSDAGSPLVLNSGIAGQYTMTDGPFVLNSMEILGNTLMLYTNGEVVAALFVGAPTFWVFNKVIRGRGLIGSRAIVTFPDRHQFLMQDGEYRYNGLFVQLMNLQVTRQIILAFDLSRADYAFTIVNTTFGDIHWALPLTSDVNLPYINTAYLENYLEMPQSYLQKPVTKRDFPFTIAAPYLRSSNLTWNLLTQSWPNYQSQWNSGFFGSSFPQLIAGDQNGNVWILYTNDTQNGAGYASTATFGQKFTVNERSRGIVTRVYPGVKYNQTGYNLTVTLTLYDEVGGSISITDVQNMATDFSGPRFTKHYRRGRLGSVSFSTIGPNQPFELQGYDWDVRFGGLRGGNE